MTHRWLPPYASPPSPVPTPLTPRGTHASPPIQANWNLEWPQLYAAALAHPQDVGAVQLTASGVLTARTGARTGRSPKDKFIVNEGEAADKVWVRARGGRRGVCAAAGAGREARGGGVTLGLRGVCDSSDGA